ncbi:DUF998 domain-containing protein [Blastococcus sp. TF02A-26]|uniref:DUF998 domain-containing protein n=1 Tax=Blastococcus sp. TF02A-26 TaxID=2250577 RepID=UPI000DE9DE6D|nr:DUF998 domain-containing protein [Blastococcus sp. TF02A-26]RBY80790.1 hypothetical protein DQ240_21130 [Blastococcus sp. TF02A-26]
MSAGADLRAPDRQDRGADPQEAGTGDATPRTGDRVTRRAGGVRRGAQTVDGAWLARLGFLMAAAAAFSHRPWQPGRDFDRTEDLLHSVAATTMGIAFAAGVVATAVLAARRGRRRARVLDAVALAASVVLPLGMSALPEADGVLQRLMFAVAYVWYGREALVLRRTPDEVGTRRPG